MSKYSSRVFNALQRARKTGLSGDIAAGGIAALMVGLPLYVVGPTGNLWGVPMSIVWAGVAGVAITMLSISIFRNSD